MEGFVGSGLLSLTFPYVFIWHCGNAIFGYRGGVGVVLPVYMYLTLPLSPCNRYGVSVH